MEEVLLERLGAEAKAVPGALAQPQDKHPLFENISALIKAVIFTLAFTISLEADFQHMHQMYFFHVIIFTVVLWFGALGLQHAVERWSTSGDETLLKKLMGNFLLKFIMIFVTFLSVSVAQMISRQLAGYLRRNSVLSLNFSRPLVLVAMMSFVVVVLEFFLTRPLRPRPRVD